MNELRWGCWAILAAACGGRAHVPDAGAGGSGFAGSPTDAAGATSSAGAPGVGPIDTTGLSAAFPEPLCEGPLKSLHLALPCKVGLPLGTFNVIECYDTTGRTALSFAIELTRAASSIGQPLPFSSTLPPVPATPIEVEGARYTATLEGSLTFKQVDPAGRAFVALLTGEFVTWKDASGTPTDCGFDPMDLWATAGDFL
ncbi:MAG: hypothetical protein ABIQ16_10485 [Polyangiaceae bacterium]